MTEPTCRNGTERIAQAARDLPADGYLNVHKSHWGICRSCGTKWPIGSDLFSSWKNETKEDWGRNAELLSDLTEVQPIADPSEGQGLRLFRPGDD